MTKIIQNAITCDIADFCQKKRGLFFSCKKSGKIMFTNREYEICTKLRVHNLKQMMII